MNGFDAFKSLSGTILFTKSFLTKKLPSDIRRKSGQRFQPKVINEKVTD